MTPTYPLPAADYWRLVAAQQRVTIAELQAKWAVAKAETDRAQVEAEIRQQYQVPPGAVMTLAGIPQTE